MDFGKESVSRRGFIAALRFSIHHASLTEKVW